jgi:hypothetical protein
MAEVEGQEIGVMELLQQEDRVVKGRNRDTAWYAAIDKEWPVLRAAFEQWLSPSNFDEQGEQRVSLASLTRTGESSR